MSQHDYMLQRQIELEIEMSGLGRDRYLSRVRKNVDKERGYETDTGRSILESVVGPVSQGITRFVEDAYSGRPGPRAVAAKLIKDMDHDVVAYLASRAILGRMMKPRSPVLMTLAVAVARAVELEARFREFRKQDKDRFDYELRKLSDDGATEQHKAVVLTFAMGKHGIAWDRWSRTEMIHLGIKLVELFGENTGLTMIQQAHEGGDKNAPRDQYLVHLTERAVAWIDQSIRGGEYLFPDFLPMLVPPKDWTGLSGGGYYTDLDRPLPLVRRPSKKQFELLKRELAQTQHRSILLKGLNAIQRTPWQINGAILDVMAELAKSNEGIAGLVPGDRPMPARPHDIDTNPEALRQWKWAARDVYTENLQLRQDRLHQETLLGLAGRFRDERAIYFPHNLDFRGRAYPVPLVLHPQGSDPVKALLRFAEGKPLGHDGARWLSIHGANTFGVDKVSFDERVAWVADNAWNIVQCATDPFENRWWTEADKPWCFLAFCFEFHRAQCEGDAFVSHIPIALDGSCNGLQHFSAMLLDAVGGAAVNLIPAEKPQDIYQRVADRVMEQLRLIVSTEGTDAERGRWAHEWLQMGITRGVTKRPVMVLPYGGTPRSCLKYVQEGVKARLEARGIQHNLGDEYGKAVGFLSTIVWDSIGDVVIAAREAMGWLQKTARMMAKENLPMHWTTPSGFVAYQGYVDMKSRLIKTSISGNMVRLRMYEDTDVFAVPKQATSISPNYVHSMDASAMILTVAELSDRGLTDFAMIHDSYGTHACNTSLLASTLRKVFVEMYQQDPLTKLRDELVLQSLDAPEIGAFDQLPSKGTLDLSLVLQSDFFFA
ncbi:DNA-dependent RNA polymerase [Mesorhizobium sp. M7A.F.Ca.US.002.01.1.1]|uniref:DNA-directed RNA polymerase n=1 Tax=Mesorhizobium sp. M7A.F.Ca.US.002.01.1.1 TaxID=2496700 RepID=UPI000FD48DDA|nr:DNA-directed RNA polymerase [Mesorhizobium sp. M7A.F.Ca.US.002.01.1.1]RVA09404.1 DNA-dependent RNA polymerase [Mesorhizobium sp. M7A.F.Ca.US.002.01.1.1]